MFARQIRSTHWAARIAVVGLATGVIALAGSGAAMAKSGTHATPKAAKSDSLPAGGATIERGDRIAWLKDNKSGSAPVIEFSLKYANGAEPFAYCIDFNHNADASGNEYDPGKWDTSNVKNLPKIQWLLTNGFHAGSADDVFKAAGADATGLPDKDFVAYVATQTAIWHYSDGIDIIANDPGHQGTKTKNLSGAEYTAMSKVEQYLVKEATDAPEPAAPGVSISPEKASGVAGDNVGPFTVKTTGSVTDLKLHPAAGASVVDKDGKPLAAVKNGTKFWLQTTNTGSASVTLSGTGTIPSGQVYEAKAGPNKYQKLILADTGTRPVSATATAETTASPSPSASPTSASPSASAPATVAPSASGTAGGGLPVTGTSLPIIIGSALVLLVGGGAIVLMARRRRSANL